MSEADLMRMAIEKTREGIAAGQSPFGSIIVKDGEVVASTHNTVWRDTDPRSRPTSSGNPGRSPVGSASRSERSRATCS